MQTIKFKLLHKDAKLPSRAHDTDAAFDVIAISREIKDGYISYGLGFSTEIPAGWEGKIYARSSISNYDLVLCNGVGIIDSAYRGEWGARFKVVTPHCLGEHVASGAVYHVAVEAGNTAPASIYKVGDRIAQIQFQRVPEVQFEVVEELNDSTRATGGFGSTGA